MSGVKKMKPVTSAVCKAMFGVIWSQWGNGWKLLGDDIKRAVIAQRVLFVFTGRGEPSTPEQMQAYYDAMLDYCGLK